MYLSRRHAHLAHYYQEFTKSPLRLMGTHLISAMATDLALAEKIARAAHQGQLEKLTGDEYIRHVERVVASVHGAEAKTVAWLHDVLEDTPITENDLKAQGIPEPVIQAVALLTRVPPLDYRAYIQQIKDSGNELAIAVKLADLKDHLRPNCPAGRRSRYEEAWRVLANEVVDA
jgi:(p)ppGpp synthase/HD superfamily hydrolase